MQPLAGRICHVVLDADKIKTHHSVESSEFLYDNVIKTLWQFAHELCLSISTEGFLNISDVPIIFLLYLNTIGTVFVKNHLIGVNFRVNRYNV